MGELETRMTRATTICLPEDLLETLGERARSLNTDRASYIRELLVEGVARDLVFAYREGRLSLSEAARRLGLDP